MQWRKKSENTFHGHYRPFFAKTRSIFSKIKSEKQILKALVYNLRENGVSEMDEEAEKNFLRHCRSFRAEKRSILCKIKNDKVVSKA